MKRKIEEPTESPSSLGGIELDHPAFGMIGASRVSSSGGWALFGSDFSHHNTIRLRIAQASVDQSSTYDGYRAREQYIEVEMSESQWATFVSSMNVGDGVPCTIRNLMGEYIPELPLPDQKTKFARHASEANAKGLESLAKLSEAIGRMGLSKSKEKELQDLAATTLRELKSNTDYIAERFEEHMETTVEKAKTEVHGYMNHHLRSAGLLGAAAPPLQIELKDTTDGE